ncbi:MAG: type III polyketide synthase [Planctomycetes bacterium]|nr:type III polyketide synthase [Planctomycetota bacterium]
MNTPRLHAIGLAEPAHSIGQDAAAKFAVARSNAIGSDPRFVERIYRNSKVTTRGSVLLAPTPLRPDAVPLFDEATGNSGPTTADRLRAFEQCAGPLAAQAVRKALSSAQLTPTDITHLIVVSCTGMSAPGVDCELVAELGLSPTTSRTNLGFMGCYGGIAGLRTAAAFAKAELGAVVLLVCVELCSLHFQYDAAPDQAIANSLFADGAAATIISCRSPVSVHAASISASASAILPDSADLMSWRIGNHGFEMTLAPKVPEHIKAHLRPWLEPWLAGVGLAVPAIASWAIHPGGPKIIAAALEGLGLPDSAAAESAAILSSRGNMSSATVFFVLDALLKSRGASSLPSVLLAFGPGLSAEAALLTPPPP